MSRQEAITSVVTELQMNELDVLHHFAFLNGIKASGVDDMLELINYLILSSESELTEREAGVLVSRWCNIYG